MTTVTPAGCSTSYLTPSEDCFEFLPNPPQSYMYGEGGRGFLFRDNDLGKTSLLPPSPTREGDVIYTLDPSCEPAVYFKNRFIKRLDVLCQLVPDRDKEGLYAIAQAAIFIFTGKRDQVIPNTVRESQGVDLYFLVEDEEHLPHEVIIHKYPSSDSSLEEYSSDEGSPLQVLKKQHNIKDKIDRDEKDDR